MPVKGRKNQRIIMVDTGGGLEESKKEERGV